MESRVPVKGPICSMKYSLVRMGKGKRSYIEYEVFFNEEGEGLEGPTV